MNALTCLELRPSLWSLTIAAPRVLVQLGSVAALAGLAAGCVPAKQHEEVKTAARLEAEARARETEKLVAAERRIQELSAELARKEQALSSEQATLAASKLEHTVALKEREASALLVQQLQSDLARAGDHLAWFSNEKRDLGQALLLAEQRASTVERASGKLSELVALGRDLALLLGEHQGMGELGLEARDGVVVLEIPEGRLFAENGDALLVGAAPLLEALARAGNDHPSFALAIRAPRAGELDVGRSDRVIEALVERGLPRERLRAEVTKAAAAATPEASEASPQYSIAFVP